MTRYAVRTHAGVAYILLSASLNAAEAEARKLCGKSGVAYTVAVA